jgi:UDP-N-acetyl-D-mannosaminuronic acid dehydrogenase
LIETDAITAKVVAESTFKDVNTVFANYLALICEQYRADIKRIIELANTHPRVSMHVPGPTLGRHVCQKDPYLLISKAKLIFINQRSLD